MAVIILPSRYTNATTRPADVTQDMLDLYNVVQQINTQTERVLQTVTPTNGQTVQMLDNGVDGTLFLTPAAPLATLTINFPPAPPANSRLLQVRFIATTQSIATLTLTGATIMGSITSMNSNDCFFFQQVTPGGWILNQ